MKRQCLLLTLFVLGAGQLQAQGRTTQPPATDAAIDTLSVLSARDSAIYKARITASRRPFNDCQGQAFQTCASGETEARLSSDGTAYGVLMTRKYDGKAAYLWRITGRVGGGGAGAGGAGGKGRRGGGGGGGRGAKRRG
jgi:hypothetical protein